MTVGTRLARAGMNAAYGTQYYADGPYPEVMHLNSETKSMNVSYSVRGTELDVRDTFGFEVFGIVLVFT